jgi:hypothetical protein
VLVGHLPSNGDRAALADDLLTCDRPSGGGRHSGGPVMTSFAPARGNASFWHLIVLFLGLAGLADGLAPKERRYAHGRD